MSIEDYPKKVKIKDGEEIILHPMFREDGEELKVFFDNLSEEEKPYIRDEDINPVMAAPWPGYLDYHRMLPILAFIGGCIVGVATLHRSDLSWMMHLGHVRITVSPEYRRKGLGRILAGELFRNSLHLGLDKIVAEIVKDQVEVSLFYNSLGFRTEASLCEHYLDNKGSKHDILIMSNSLKQLWKYWVEQNEKGAA